MEHVMTRQEVFDVVEGELDYQTRMEGDSASHVVPNIPLGSILLAMEHNLAEARKTWYSGLNPHRETMDFVRKVTALGVKAGLQQGMPNR